MMPQNLILLLFGVSEAANKMHFMSAHRPRELQSSSGIISTADERYEGTGGECVFPFRYNGLTFRQCAQDGDWFWCSTKTDDNDDHVSGGNHWGWCLDGCEDPSLCGVGQICVEGECQDQPSSTRAGNLAVCNLPSGIVGPCFAAFPRFTYSKISRSCERFTYGGCLGNDNNFSSETECNQTCVQPLSTRVAPIDACACTREYIPVCGTDGITYSNSCTADCANTIVAYEGECGNADCNCTTNFMPVCKIVTNSAGYFVIATTYNNECLANCSGITNNSVAEIREGQCNGCENPWQCGDEETCVEGECQSVCNLPSKVVGRCLAFLPRFSYNKETGSCEPFNYGGCGGNENNFSSEIECNQECGVCSLPSGVVGLCRAAIPSFTYNKKTGSCERFIYGGCGGNENNFSRLEECNQECVTPPVFQTLPTIRIAGIISTPDRSQTPTAKGGLCVSPFIFDSQEFDRCVRDGDWSWCSTQTDSNGVHVSGEGNWGWCPAGTMPQIFTDSVIGGSDGKNQKCVFPFRFNGSNYYDCAPPLSTDAVPRKWCSTFTDAENNHVDGERNWGRCI